MSDYLLWFGSLMTTSASADNTNAMSPAADRWQRALAQALAGCGVRVEFVSYVARQAWPKGPLGVAGEVHRQVAAEVGVAQVGYNNVPIWRVGSVAAKRFAAGMRRARRAKPRAIITYNAHPITALAAMAVRRFTGVPWLCLVADLDSPSPMASRSPLAIAEWSALTAADARVYLSAAMADQFNRLGDLHLDGGVDGMRERRDGEAGRVVYAGALTAGAGVDLAVAAFRHVKHPDAKLVVYGNGDASRIRALAAADPRVEVMGMVPRDELAEGLARARVLLNPRLPHLPENARNFPSKLLDYLAHGKPIVSTWTAGLTEEYRPLLITSEAGPAAFSRDIDRALALDATELAATYARIQSFAESHSWTHQARRFLSTIDRITE